jgi:methionine--tRNA ligase beta chain
MKPLKSAITYPDFDKLDFRVGTIVEATSPDWSRKLLRFTVDFGAELGKRIIFSGIKTWYTPEEFIGKQYIFLVNLKPKKMGEEESQGMMLMSDTPDGTLENDQKPSPIPLQNPVENGTVVR